MARKVKRVKHRVKKTRTIVHKRSGAGKKSGGSGALRSIFHGW